MGDAGPGVPEGIPTTLRLLRDRLGVERLDRLWLFPPLVKGRREQGVVVVACFLEDDAERRRIVTARYAAERTGRGLTVEPELFDDGIAPVDSLDRVIEGVVQRAELALEDPRDVEVAGDRRILAELLDQLDENAMEGMEQ